MALSDYKIIGPLCYMGKVGCENVTCRHVIVGHTPSGDPIFDAACRGYHCSYCDEPCSSQGHRCDAAEAILGEARRVMEEVERDDAA